MPKVLVSVPNTGWIHKLVTLALLRLQQAPAGHQLTIITPTWSPYEHNLNRIANDVLQGGYDYWLNIDADNPPMQNPLPLVELDADVVGLPTPQWHDAGPAGDRPIFWVAMDDAGEAGFREHQTKRGLQEVGAVGSGCWLVARRVLAALPHPIFERVWSRQTGYPEVGVDFNFCRKARGAGFRVFAHYDYPCRHFKELELTDVVQMDPRIPARRGPGRRLMRVEPDGRH